MLPIVTPCQTGRTERAGVGEVTLLGKPAKPCVNQMIKVNISMRSCADSLCFQYDEKGIVPLWAPLQNT